MRSDDSKLIQRVLSGDDTAFTELVKKYQKPVHALVWRKVGDFHIAEEITQDTFLKAYQKLAMLKEPQSFASWLYVIATRHCIAWLRKKRLWIQSLEATNSLQFEKATYSGYVVEENERTTIEAQREVVKKLLAKLQESERTVMTLHYFGEMTCEEISKFLGVSVGAIKSRLSRARHRLKKEEPMIREALENFQITPNLTENIMREVSRLKPVAPSNSKPFVPWAIGVSTLAVVLLMLGVGNQHLSRFQKPYSFDAAAEMTVELIEAPVVLNLESKPDVRTQFGNAAAPSKNNGFSQHLDQPEYTTLFAAAQVDQTEERTVTDGGNRHIILEASTHEESGEVLADGRFRLTKTGEVLTSTGYRGTGSGDMLMRYTLNSHIDLFRFPLVIGDTWAQKGPWAPQIQTTLVGYEKIEVAAGTFTNCLKHKTIFANAERLRSPLVNGTRYLWFAKGVGVVKMRYEHFNGGITEAELLDYNVPRGEEYLPLQYGNMWTYKLQNEHREKPIIEKCKVVENSDQPLNSLDSHFFSHGPPRVRKIIPDLSEKVSIIIEDIRISFSEVMVDVDIASASVPIGDLKWIDGGRTLVIPFRQPLLPSKTYRLILAEGYRNMAGVAFPEYTLTFTTEGPEPVTPTFVDTTPVYVTDIEELDISNELLCRVTVNPTEGFNFPYYLFIPQGIDLNKPVHLLVEPCNTGVSRTRKSLDRKTKALAEASHATLIAKKLRVPLLVPVFPRPGSDQWLVPVSTRPGSDQWQAYTHALDRDTLLIRDGDLKRIDLQLINMIAHAQRLLRHNKVNVNEKVFMNGFSASGTFANRFAILHPTVVRAVATGGVNGIPTFPTDRWEDVLMRYPVGIADVKEIAGIKFDGAAYKKVSQYIYMGTLDDNDIVPYPDAYDAVDAELVKSLIGTKMIPDRWEVSQSIYKALEIPAQFVTYKNTGHQIKREMIDDIVAFFKANSGDEIVKIVPYQYPSSFAAAASEGEDVSVSKQQWIPAEPISGTAVQSLFATPEGDLYTHAKGELYKLPANEETWQHIFDIWTLPHSNVGTQTPIAKWNDTLYYTQSSELFASADDGKTWDLLYAWDPDKYWDSTALILTEQAFYMAFSNGVFSSEDTGKTWKAINDGLAQSIWSLVEVEDTLFAGTEDGFYRLGIDGWKRLKFPMPIGRVPSVVVSQGRLFVLGELSWNVLDPRKVSRGLQRGWGIFRSNDLGTSWKDITPTNAWTVNGFIPEAKLIATGETLLLIERRMVRSTDGGNTWLPPQLPGTTPFMDSYNSPATVLNTGAIYVGSWGGLHRSTDGGKSWEIVNITPNESGIDNLIVFKELDKEQNPPSILHGTVGVDVVKTIDGGNSWVNVPVEIPMTKSHREQNPRVNHIVKSGGVVYAGVDYYENGEKVRLYRVSADGRTFVPIQGMPFFDSGELKRLLPQNLFVETLQEKYSGAAQFFKYLVQADNRKQNALIRMGLRGAFTVSGDTFYMEYNYKLFRWEPGDAEWYDTEQEETVELSLDVASKNLKLAASGNTVYVGKRDGHLVVSFDKGNNWLDLTPALPFPVKAFYDIVFAGSTVYVATDAGVAASSDGKQWRAITDAAQTPLIIEQLAVDGTTLYGVSKTGVYRLENNTWKEVISEIPNGVTSLAVDRNVLYVGTQGSGMLHFNLDE